MGINEMIDAACGVVGRQANESSEDFNMRTMKDPVLLYCACGAKKVVEREPDFFDYATIETTCPDCRESTQSESKEP